MDDFDPRSLQPGDVFGVSHAGGAESVCMVTTVEDEIVRSTVVNGQYDMAFHRDTGEWVESRFDGACILEAIDGGHVTERGMVRHMGASITFVGTLPESLCVELRALDARLRPLGNNAYLHGDPDAVFKRVFAVMDGNRGRAIAVESPSF